MKKKLFVVTLLTLLSIRLPAQLNPALDVQHYRFSIQLNDSNNIIRAEAQITIRFLQDVKEVKLDLVQRRPDGKGMDVMSVKQNEGDANFVQDSQHVVINAAAKNGDVHVYTIAYEGIPADGIIISKNKYGDRTFFSDNWPDRAHNWLPCNDHPFDKASVEFVVTAPEHYQVVSNGLQVEETNLPNHLKLTYWKEDVPLPTKVMVIGAANFAVNYVGNIDCIPISSWVYAEDRDKGFQHYAVAEEILPWYIKNIGPYAYKKLANVQSKTIFGGMENASAIFYFENSVNDDTVDALFAHEIAHQWFGNSACEADWPHLWLSEGFATYMAHLYLESKYGVDSFNKRMIIDRLKIIAISKKRSTPIVDTTEKNDLMQLLNDNTYRKGGWVLHMLRRRFGDSLFWKGIRAYYATYAGRNANTEDLQKIFEDVSGQNLHIFFKQWLYTPGHPKLNIDWKYDNAKKSVNLRIEQVQDNLFEFPLEIGFSDGNKTIIRSVEVRDKITTKEISLNISPVKIIADPNVYLLFEAQINKLQ